MEFYLQGVLWAFVIGLIKIGLSIHMYFSFKSKNMAKVGVYYSWTAGTFDSPFPTTFGRFFSYLCWMLVLAPLASWLSILSSIVAFLNAQLNKKELPGKLKEADFKLSHFDLSMDDVKKILIENLKELKLEHLLDEVGGIDGFISTDGQPKADTLSDIEDSLNTFTLCNDETGVEKLYLDRARKQFTKNSHPQDYLSDYKKIYEYKVSDGQLFVRLLSSIIEYAGEDPFYDVQDNTVLESEIRKRMEIRVNGQDIDEEEYEEKVNSLKKAVKFQPLEGRIKYYIFAMEKPFESEIDCKRFYRTELERLNTGFQKFEKWLNSFGLKIEFNQEYKYYDYSKDVRIPEERREEFCKVLDLESDKFKMQFGIRFHEFQDLYSLRSDLNHWLGKDGPASVSAA